MPAGKYRGIDGSHSPVADEVVDLTTYACGAGGTSVRHVPENNHEREATLRNAVGSFRREVVLAKARRALGRLQALGPTIPATTLNALRDWGAGYVFTSDADARYFLRTAQYFIKLLEGSLLPEENDARL